MVWALKGSHSSLLSKQLRDSGLAALGMGDLPHSSSRASNPSPEGLLRILLRLAEAAQVNTGKRSNIAPIKEPIFNRIGKCLPKQRSKLAAKNTLPLREIRT